MSWFLSEKVKLISTKALTEDLINKYSVLNVSKYFSSSVLQNYLAFIPVNKYADVFSGTNQIYSWKSKGISEIKNPLDTLSKDLSTDFTLGNCLFRAIKLTKNADTDKFGYSGYIGFEAGSQFLFSDNRWGKNVVIFGVDNSSSGHVHNKKKYICSW